MKLVSATINVDQNKIYLTFNHPVVEDLNIEQFNFKLNLQDPGEDQSSYFKPTGVKVQGKQLIISAVLDGKNDGLTIQI